MRPEEILPTSSILKAVGRPSVYYSSFAHFFGSCSCAIFLCHFMYWEGKQEDPDGWIYKSMESITAETGLGRYEIEAARKKLKEIGVLQETLKGTPARLWYLFNWEEFDKHFADYMQTNKKFKKVKPPKEEGTQKVNMNGLMHDIFNEGYFAHNNLHYIWSKSTNGRDFKCLKEIREKLIKTLIDRKKIDGEVVTEIPDEEVLNSWKFLLDKMSAFHKDHNFTPAKINSNFNSIITDIKNEFKGKSSANKNELASAGASSFA